MSNRDQELIKGICVGDFAVSDSYPDLAAEIIFTPLDVLKSLYLTKTIIVPIIEQFKMPHILSGKRPPGLNKLVGGAEYSDHLWDGDSCAVDITVLGNVLHCYNMIKDRLPHAFGQLIYYPRRNFIHVSMPTIKHHGEAWIKENS